MNKIKAGTFAGVAIGGLGLLALATPAQAAEACNPQKAYDSTVVVTPASVKHHDALTHDITVHHDEVSHVVHHDAVTHVVHHDEVSHVVHHDAVTHEVTVVDQDAWDEVVVDQQAYDETVPGQHHDAVTHEESRWKLVAPYWTVEHKEVYGYKYVNTHWVSDPGNWNQVPDSIVAQAGINPFTVAQTGTVPAGTYGLPKATQYRITSVDVYGTDPHAQFELKQVTGPTVYYVPGGTPSTTLTDANWTATAPGGSWIHVDDRTVTDKAAYDDPPTVVHHDAVTHTVHHDAVTHQETVVDQEAYDETVVDSEAWDETVVDAEAYDETVVDQAAYDETVTVVDKDAYDEQVPAVTKTVHHNGVTCEVVVVPKQTPPPAQPQTVALASDSLAHTGTDVPWWLLAAAGGAVVGGAGGLVAVGRARHRKAV